MSRMATQLRRLSFSTVGIVHQQCFCPVACRIHQRCFRQGMADIEASRLAHQKTESKEVKDSPSSSSTTAPRPINIWRRLEKTRPARRAA